MVHREMAAIAFALSQTSLPVNAVTFLIAGFIASAAMVLPGISGSYLLLIFGLYGPLTTKIREFIHLVREMDIGACVQVPSFDAERLTQGVEYADNGNNLQSTSMLVLGALLP